MNFRPELAAKVMAGEKTVTRRLVSDNPRSPWFVGGCTLQIGRDYAVCPGRGKNAIGRVRITNVYRLGLWPISDAEANKEGFPSAQEFRATFTAINKVWTPDAVVWRIEFEVLETTS